MHDMIVLFASVRHQVSTWPASRALEVGKVAGLAASFGVLFILVLTLAGLSPPWSTP